MPTLAISSISKTNIKTVVITSDTSIGDYVFAGCRDLKAVYYKGTASDWNNISTGSYNDYFETAPRYYYSATEPALNSDGTTYDGNYWHYDTDGKTPIVWKKEN